MRSDGTTSSNNDVEAWRLLRLPIHVHTSVNLTKNFTAEHNALV